LIAVGASYSLSAIFLRASRVSESAPASSAFLTIASFDAG
jgi:hypothetical protein